MLSATAAASNRASSSATVALGRTIASVRDLRCCDGRPFTAAGFAGEFRVRERLPQRAAPRRSAVSHPGSRRARRVTPTTVSAFSTPSARRSSLEPMVGTPGKARVFSNATVSPPSAKLADRANEGGHDNSPAMTGTKRLAAKLFMLTPVGDVLKNTTPSVCRFF
jgi:hypothetical protein